jgi:hypothetical protein
MMIEVSNVIRAYPDPHEGATGISSIAIKSHWNDPSKIVLLVEGCCINLYAHDIIAGIQNSINTGRFLK